MFAVMPSNAATAAATESLHRSRSRSRSSKVDLYCQFCQRRFNKSYNLMIHERSHLNDQQHYYCDVCGKSFRQKEMLKQHRNQHSPGGSSSGSSSGYSPTNPFF